MATIGITFFLDGFGQAVWGSEVRGLDLGIPQDPWIVGDIYINQFDVFAADTCGARWRYWRCSSSSRRSDGRCVRSPTTTRRR